jgi:hypothetical protein
MISWLVRGALIVSGVIAGWFVSKDSPNFTLVQGATALWSSPSRLPCWPSGRRAGRTCSTAATEKIKFENLQEGGGYFSFWSVTDLIEPLASSGLITNATRHLSLGTVHHT